MNEIVHDFCNKKKANNTKSCFETCNNRFCKGVTSDFWQVIFATNNKCMLQRLSITFCNGKQVSFETSIENFLQRVIFRMSNKWFLYGVTSDFTTSKERRAICYES